MLILILGVALWWAAHLWKRVAPGSRAKLGDKGRGIIVRVLIVSVLLMVLGYKFADGPVWWGPSAAMKGINNLLVLVAFYLFAAAGMKTAIARRLRHPMLLGFALWSFAHLLPNGDLASFVLFGGLLVWALVQMALISRAEPDWTPPAPAPLRKEFMALAGTLIVFGVVAMIHMWLGYSPFGA